MNIKRLISEARKEALRSPHPEFRVGAVLVKGGKIVGRGHNRYGGKIKFFSKRYAIELFSLHAEMDCFLDAGMQEGGVMVIAGSKRKNGNPFKTKPCKHCQRLLDDYGIECVWEE